LLLPTSNGFAAVAMSAPKEKAAQKAAFRGRTGPTKILGQHLQALNDLLIRLFGSFAVFLLVSFAFIPRIRAQKLFLRAPPSGCGGLRSLPGFSRS
jgi:hypothetical protein